MGDIAVDIFLQTLKQLITCSKLDFPIDTKDQLQSLEKEIKYLREFLKITEKKRNDYSEVMKLVMQIRDVVTEAEDIVELFMVLVSKADHASDSLREHQDQIENVKKKRSSVKKKIKTLTNEVKHFYKKNMYDLNGVEVKKLMHSSPKREAIAHFYLLEKRQTLWAVEFFLETLKQHITSSNLDFPIDTKYQLQSLENEIKYLRRFLEITEKKHNKIEKKHKQRETVIKLVRQIRDMVSEAENIVELFMVLVSKADHAPDSLREHRDQIENVKKKRSSVKKKIKTLTNEVKHFYEKNTYDLNGVEVKKLMHSSRKAHFYLLEKRETLRAVDFFLETLKQHITSSNLDFPIDTKYQLQSLENEIKYLRRFLKITEKKHNKIEKKHKQHETMIKLVRQIRDMVSEAENIVELFMVLVFKANHASDSLREHQDFLEGVKKKRSSVKEKIKTLTDEVKHIYEENMYDLNGVEVKNLKHSSSKSEGGSSSLGGRNTSKAVEEKAFIGFKDELETLMGKLHDSGEGRQLEIISIIGVGGGGKTTLAREVYDHPLTLHKFDIRAWANISQDYHKTMKRDLLNSILESASPGKQEGNCELGENVYKCLKGRKYLIVMDDMWDIEAWNDIQRSFPRECKGSKVMLTSRLPVQPASVPCVPHYLMPLPKSCSWELLQKKVFGKEQCPLELVDIGKQMAEKCKGLPLAIIAIAGILATKDKTLDVWKKVAKNLSSIIAKSSEGCVEILELSYNHLPLHLKACFLYIGGQPEDSEIPVRDLIWLWIAEGFIQQSDGGKSLEAIAQDYLIGLIDRNLVMVATKSKSHGGIKGCRIHDLLRELCIKKAKEDNFLVQNYRDESFSTSATNNHRRLFVVRQFFHKLPPRPHARNLRSFLYLPLPNSSDIFPSSYRSQNLSFFVENFELLRVLHLMSAPSLGEIAIGDLVHLRYLALTLPSPHALNCFHYLLNLEILNLKISFLNVISLPRHIVKMVKLRHLYTKFGVFEYHQVSNYDEEMGNMLDSLQTLHRLCICEHCLCLLERTPNLRKLGLCTPCKPTILLDLEFLKCLEILYVHCWGVQLLKLPPTLTRLTLNNTRLKWEELSIILQTLPSLEVLKLLGDACAGPVWNTSELEEGFSQLKYLKFKYMNNMKEWNASEDQFPRLEVLVIESCKRLTQIPIDFANLNELRKLIYVIAVPL